MEPSIYLTHGNDTLEVKRFGATVTSWRVDGEEILFMSEKSSFDCTAPIRGGIPIVFPNFGPWALGPHHGFAHTMEWTIKEPPTQTDQDARVVLKLVDDDYTRSIWDHRFEFSLSITLKKSELDIQLAVTNNGGNEFEFTVLVHPYWKVPDVRECQLSGCHGTSFIDKTRNYTEYHEERELVKVAEWTDSIYKETQDRHTLSGVSGNRTLLIDKKNLPDTVVWNPWSKMAAELPDFGSQEFLNMVCVEPGHVAKPIRLEPGRRFDASCTFRIAE
uniref:glucose-6-phosphate 1-epimerase n=1 Tax=Ixodes ricinus TaxID=34613 RepID=V5IHU1_IXORI